jgi:DNA-directed RNA polymerase specialized sigma24 family protein
MNNMNSNEMTPGAVDWNGLGRETLLDRRPRTGKFFTMPDAADQGMQAGLRRAERWRVPTNWCALDWSKELKVVALAAAWQAFLEYDAAQGVPLGGFIFVRVQSRTLTRYRQEWRYALRTSPADDEFLNSIGKADGADSPAGPVFDSLDLALNQLAEGERWILEQLFWQHRTETNIAQELCISQPAVNKRKKLAFHHLRALL